MEHLEKFAEQISKRQPIQCTKCGEPFALDLIVKAAENSTLRFSVTPGKGELMHAKSIGKLLSSASDLLRAIGKQMEVNTQVMLQRASTEEDGTLHFDLLICRTPRKPDGGTR